MTDPQRRLNEKSAELLDEADQLSAVEHAMDALPAGSAELVDVAEHAQSHAARLRDVAHEDEQLTREVAERSGE